MIWLTLENVEEEMTELIASCTIQLLTFIFRKLTHLKRRLFFFHLQRILVLVLKKIKVTTTTMVPSGAFRTKQFCVQNFLSLLKAQMVRGLFKNSMSAMMAVL